MDQSLTAGAVKNVITPLPEGPIATPAREMNANEMVKSVIRKGDFRTVLKNDGYNRVIACFFE